MSDFVIHKGRRPADVFARHYGTDVMTVLFDPAHPTQVILADKRKGQGTCLGCGHAPCTDKHASELTLAGGLDAYPGDPSLDVCPTGAIGWDDAKGVAIVDSEACIGCGLCVVRCPYGAISLNGGAVAEVIDNDPSGLVKLAAFKGKHAKPDKVGVVAYLSAPAAAALPASVGGLGDTKGTLLIRNLLHEVGVNARVRRRGDTNMRIDAVGLSRSGRPFVGEIELSSAVLESPRALLEDVAVLHARYGYAVANIDAISVILSYPNLRSEYYQVIRDIKNVLGVRCQTITVGALVALLWTGSQLDGFEDHKFGPMIISHKNGSFSYAPAAEEEPYPGAFTPAK